MGRYQGKVGDLPEGIRPLFALCVLDCGMKPRIIKITIERQPENVWLATSKDLPGFNVEIADSVQIYDAARKLAVEFMQLDGEDKKSGPLTFEFETR